MNDLVDQGHHFTDTIYNWADKYPEWRDEIRMWHDDWIKLASPEIPHSVATCNVPCVTKKCSGVCPDQFRCAEF